MRDEHEKFTSRGVTILAVGPNPPATFEQYWRNERIPFIGLPDPDHSVALLYRQEVNLFKLGRMPAQVLIDKAGIARFVHYGHSMSDIPKSEEVLALVDEMQAGAPKRG